VTNRNTPKQLLSRKRWREANPDKMKGYITDHSAARRSALAMLKLEKGCADCGYDKDPAALDFDHVGEKSFSIGDNRLISWERLLPEIDKCEVVCANCHRIRTVRRKLGI